MFERIFLSPCYSHLSVGDCVLFVGDLVVQQIRTKNAPAVPVGAQVAYFAALLISHLSRREKTSVKRAPVLCMYCSSTSSRCPASLSLALASLSAFDCMRQMARLNSRAKDGRNDGKHYPSRRGSGG